MPTQQLKEFLDRQQIAYTSVRHQAASTTQRIAAVAHVSGDALAKTVMITIDGAMAMAVLPAPQHLDIEKLRQAVAAQKIDLATEMAFVNRFPDCEAGAMPPFGNLYGMKVFLDKSLSLHNEIWFNAGTHSELLKMAIADFIGLIQPEIIDFSR